MEALTNAFSYKGSYIVAVRSGGKCKILKKSINYVRGKNVESWKLLGSASVFDSVDDCIAKFSTLVNSHRASVGKRPINFIVEHE